MKCFLCKDDECVTVEICIHVPEFIVSATALLIRASVPAFIVYVVVLSHLNCYVLKCDLTLSHTIEKEC